VFPNLTDNVQGMIKYFTFISHVSDWLNLNGLSLKEDISVKTQILCWVSRRIMELRRKKRLWPFFQGT
jgi:hypothetical protein